MPHAPQPVTAHLESEPAASSKGKRNDADDSGVDWGGDTASQPVEDGGDEPHPPGVKPKAAGGPRNALTHKVAESIEQQVREFWETRGEAGAAVLQEVKHLRMLLFRR